MAENILGLLLVVSSSRGRAVFRYPPDPASPNIRLAQPIYPSATYTAADLEMDYVNPARMGTKDKLRRKLFNEENGTVSNVSLRRSQVSSDKKRQVGNTLHPMFVEPDLAGGSVYGNGSDGDSDGSDTSSDADSDYDVSWAGGRGGTHVQSAEDTRITYQNTNGALRQVDVEASRRGSSSTTAGTVVDHHGEPNGEAHSNRDHDRMIDSQYNYALGYHLDFLSDMLTPHRAACNRKFEINVGAVVFIGHPVCCGLDGKWEFPSDEEEAPPARGRKGREQPSSLGPLVEQKEMSSPEAPASKPTSQVRKEEIPSLNMFHLVLIIDKPDPKPGTEAHDEHHNQTLGMYDEVYREIAFKWTAAAWKLQCESNFIAKQVWTMAKYKEKCLNEGIDITECCKWMYANIPLDRNLNTLYLRLHQLKTQPVNPLHSYLPTTITSHMADMTIHTVLSPRTVDPDEAWAHWGERDAMSESEASSSDDDDWDDPTAAIKRPELKVDPWQTLLLIDDDATARATEISQSIIGLGIAVEEQQAVIPGDRRGSKATIATTIATTQAEEDETALMKALIEGCDVTKPLAEIAHLLRFDLEAVVIPLARELVENKKAILVDVINTRLRTIVMPTTVDEHTVSIAQYSARFTRQFPDLPPFPAFISKISASPAPFRDILPSDPDMDTRREYMAALIWLLKHDLVVQAHTRVRVFARKEVKVEAWKRLWKRRRRKWLVKRRESQHSHPGSDQNTPRAIKDVSNPMDATVPPPFGHVDLGEDDPEYMTYDAAMEMDSDEEMDGGVDHAGESGFRFDFSEDVTEPSRGDIPKFERSFIFKPSRAQKDEARWLRVIREDEDPVTSSKFDLVVSYFDGMTTLEEISYRTGLPRRELDRIMKLYADDIMTFVHP
ncbi:hypothetical protein IAU60_005988 [Kwoniella sp. DSM 27419]